MTEVATIERAAPAGWPALNQRWLSSRIAFWRERLEQRERTTATAVPSRDHDEEVNPTALHLARVFGLSTFETELLVLAAGVEIDAALRRAVAAASGLEHEPFRVTFSLALSLLPDPHWDAASPLRPLRYWSLVDFDTSAGFAQAALRVDERILHYITGVDAFDDRLKGIARLDELAGEADDQLAGRLARDIETLREPLVLLSAASAADPARFRAGRALAGSALSRAGLRPLWVDAPVLSADPRELADIARAVDREAALAPAGIVLPFDADSPHAAQAIRFIDAVRSPVVMLGALTARQAALLPRRAIRRFTVAPVEPAPAADLHPAVAAATRRALQQFRVEPAALDQALAVAALAGDEHDAADRVWDALRESARGGLDTLAERIDSRTTFSDLVVPPSVAAQLREIAGQLQQRHRVHDEWGFADRDRRGLGLAALFAGESGTGKTLAAEAIANSARLDLYRIDLASVVSKYIGETEKNLSKVFDAAERSGAVLFFDEADALFGKRSEVKDSHDRYANIEIAYLLQRIESYAGLAILATNMKASLDRAFLRRIRFVVQFPFPDEAARDQIWRLQMPRRAPVGTVDYRALAKLQLSGGHIRSVAINAAFLAAQRGGPIEQNDFIAAARAEFAKLERTFTPPGATA